MGLGTSGAILEKGEWIELKSVWLEVVSSVRSVRGSVSGVASVIGWKGNWEKLVGLSSESRNYSGGVIEIRISFKNTLHRVVRVRVW